MVEKSIATKLPQATNSTDLATRLTVWIPVFLVMIFIGLRIYHITTFGLWGGEAFTMIGSRQDWAGMFTYIIDDIVHPPLIYILLKLWIGIGGESVLWLKLLPDIFGILMVLPFFLLCRELNLKSSEMYLALLCMAVNGYLVHYSQELRMYSMLAFWSLCSFWLFIRYFKSTHQQTKILVALSIVNLLGIYSHYYGWLVVGMEFLFLLIWRRHVLRFAISIVVLLLCFSPWAFLVMREASAIGGLERNLGWIPKPGVIDVLNFYITLIGPMGTRYLKLLGLMIFNLPLLPWIWHIVRAGINPENEDLVVFSWLAMLSFVPVALVYIISQKYDQALWIDRYFIFIAAAYITLVAVAVNRLQPAWIRNLWIAVIVLWSVVAGITDLRTNRIAWSSPQLGSRIAWDDITRQMSEAELSQAYPIKVYTLPIVSKGHSTGDWAISTSLTYYLDALNDDRFQMVYAKDVNRVIENEQGDHFWIAYFDIADWRQPSPTPTLTNNGFRVGDEIVFNQLGNRLVLLPVWKQ